MAKKGGGMIGSKVEIPDAHAFGTDAEIYGREHEAHQEAPTTFTQIGPQDNPSMNLAHADQSAHDVSGRFKFSKGV